MPKPTRPGQRYMPGLDGLRAVAVLAVIAYHEQFSWALGGLLGVGVFFTLSGYLITSILLSQWAAESRLHLREFWLARARRLLPALFVMLAVVTAWVTIADRSRLPSLRGAVAAAATYSSNWYAIVQQQSYFARFAPPGPLDHLWSLAVEEQFYLVWPALLLLGLFFLRGRRTSAVGWLALPALGLAAASVALMTALYQPGPDPTRVYEGTDTRASGLLIGAALAMFLAARRRPSAEPAAQQPAAQQPAAQRARGRIGRIALDVAGFAGLAGIGLMVWRVGEYSPFLYRGGLVVLSVATVAVVAAVACPGTLVGAALGWGPLRWVGARSYGIYLWHYPVIVLTTPANAGENLFRAAAQVAASVVIAALSWRFIEEPVRHGAIGRAWTRVRAAGWRTALTGWRTRPAGLRGLAALTGTAGLVAVAGVGLSGIVAVPAGAGQAPLAAGATQPLSSRFISRSGAHPVFAGGAQADRRADSAAAGKGSSASGASAAGGSAAAAPLRTSCRAVAHLGDSTSDGLVSRQYLPNPKQRIQARYEDVGARSVWTNIAGGRSIVEVLPGTVNGYDAVHNMAHQGFKGCWVLALGTDDTADVAAGSETPLATRIARMMSAAHGEPVMWVNVKSLVSSGPYAEPNMQRWDAALVKA
ncbi:MAG TPA: acyltransferase family protein, partial [Streptosporangiaceae bacterium]|nr:acyltransferase family protein [Streptosporangiaceae bacterium]